jgi:hypothetical protein
MVGNYTDIGVSMLILVQEICYNIRFVELNGRNRGDPWSLRRAGVYHQIRSENGQSRWIFLNLPQKLRDWMQNILDDFKRCEYVQRHFRIHMTVLCFTAQGWPGYVQDLSDRLDELV